MILALVMIVRDEAERLGRVALSVDGRVDLVFVVDTGSSDGTLEVARRAFRSPTRVAEIDWRGFAAARNYALDWARPHADWLLLLDADETLEGELGDLEEDESVDVIEAEIHDGPLRYWRPRLVRSSRARPWCYVGRTHEYLDVGGAAAVKATTFHVEHHRDGGTRPEKFLRDLDLLEADWREQPGPRTAFYLARTYDDLGRRAEAERWYRFRLAMDGWAEEVFYSLYRLGVTLLPDDEAVGVLWRAWELRSHRAEPLVALAEHYRGAGLYRLAWLACRAGLENYRPAGADDLFVDVDAGWRLRYEATICGWYVGEAEQAGLLLEDLLGRDLPEPYASSLRANAAFYR